MTCLLPACYFSTLNPSLRIYFIVSIILQGNCMRHR